MQELNEEIVLLRMLTAEPVKPARNILAANQLQASSAAPGRTISFVTEQDIVDNLAFLSATTDDPERVTAICLDESSQPESCTIRIAMNSGTRYKQLAMNQMDEFLSLYDAQREEVLRHTPHVLATHP
ncbi:hypothetical protein LTR46_011497 [Exophiala xenobiotica]|nr:hypothetical protein LTS15_005640 [Exophiala xenobiotica]KAK5550501.1 hypothetical protein LTR46_011497 [Exophiala xenobiotica]